MLDILYEEKDNSATIVGDRKDENLTDSNSEVSGISFNNQLVKSRMPHSISFSNTGEDDTLHKDPEEELVSLGWFRNELNEAIYYGRMRKTEDEYYFSYHSNACIFS